MESGKVATATDDDDDDEDAPAFSVFSPHV